MRRGPTDACGLRISSDDAKSSLMITNCYVKQGSLGILPFPGATKGQYLIVHWFRYNSDDWRVCTKLLKDQNMFSSGHVGRESCRDCRAIKSATHVAGRQQEIRSIDVFTPANPPMRVPKSVDAAISKGPHQRGMSLVIWESDRVDLRCGCHKPEANWIIEKSR